jgi:hypothetical protein
MNLERRHEETHTSKEVHFVIIGNSLYPYRYDAAKILGLPHGTEFKARFDEKFVSEQIRRDISELKNLYGFYCFRDFSSGTLIPLRRIKTSEVALIARTYFIRYMLLDLFDFPQEEDVLATQIASFNSSFNAVHGAQLIDNNPGGHLRPLVLMSRADPAFSSSLETVRDEFDLETRRWGSIAQYLGKLEYFHFIPFIRVLGLQEVGTEQLAIGGGPATVVGERQYELRLIHNLKTGSSVPHSVQLGESDRTVDFIQKASFELQLTADHKFIDITQPDVLVTGTYDVNYFSFRVRDVSHRSATSISIDYKKKPDSLMNHDTKISIPLDVRPNVRVQWWKFALLFLIAGVYVGPTLFPIVFQYVLKDPRILQDLSVVAFTLTLFDLISEMRRARID